MIRELHARQEVAGSNPGHRTRMCGSLPGLIYSFGQNYLATGFLRYRFLYPVPKNDAKGPGFGVPVQKPVPKALADRYLRCLF